MGDRRKQRFGRYEILSELGRGAMGIVYKARDPKINRVVAVKTISLAGQGPEEEKEYRERFFREAEAAGRLSHPGIVTIFDVGEEPETHAPYIVMEYVQGQTLDKLLLSREDHKMPPEEALQLALEVAEALDTAHGQGVVHRDIKPANILLTKEGRAKIADFGVAKMNLTNATASGRLFGTPAYMSPEQLNDEEIDGRSDLFSLGVVLYTALTGYRPFQGNSMMTVAFKVVNRDPVPATVLDNELPPGLDYIISRAIAKDRSQRYQRGMEIVLDIQELRAGREPWSKDKEPDSNARVQNSNEKTSGHGLLSVAASRRGMSDKLKEHGFAIHLLEKMRGSYFGSTLLFMAILFFAIRTGQLVWSRHQSQKNAVDKISLTPRPLPAGAAPDEANPAAQDSQVANGLGPDTSRKTTKLAASRPVTGKATARSNGAATPPAPAMLEIEVDHNFAEAYLSIWVDDRLSFKHALEGKEKKRLIVFRHVQGHEFHAMQVPAGKHSLRVQVTPDSAEPQAGTVQGEFTSGAEKLLHIQFDKNDKMNLDLQ
jgi:serine/threonine protein kinase